MSSTYRGLQHNCIRYKHSGNEAAVHSQWNKFIESRQGAVAMCSSKKKTTKKGKKPERRKESLGTRLDDKS